MVYGLCLHYARQKSAFEPLPKSQESGLDWYESFFIKYPIPGMGNKKNNPFQYQFGMFKSWYLPVQHSLNDTWGGGGGEEMSWGSG